MRQVRSLVLNIPPWLSAPTSCLMICSCTPYLGSPGKCVCWFFVGFLSIALLEANESRVRSYPGSETVASLCCRERKQCTASGRSIGVRNGSAGLDLFPAQTIQVFLWYCFENPGYCVRYPTRNTCMYVVRTRSNFVEHATCSKQGYTICWVHSSQHAINCCSQRQLLFCQIAVTKLIVVCQLLWTYSTFVLPDSCNKVNCSALRTVVNKFDFRSAS